jgi:hypothetical protein
MSCAARRNTGRIDARSKPMTLSQRRTRSVPTADTGPLLRIMKLTEETGEVTQAVTGTLGQNPRKGVTHTWDDVQAELCDVIFTAMVALTQRRACNEFRGPGSVPDLPGVDLRYT